MNGDLANYSQPMNNTGWAIGFGAVVNGVVQTYNGYKNRQHSENLQQLEHQFQEAERNKDRALQAQLQKELRDLQWKIVQENNRVLIEEGNKNRQARLLEVELNAKYAKDWCLINNYPSDLLGLYKDQKITPLRIFPVFQGFEGANLSKSPTQFLQRCYSMSSHRPVKVLDGVWNHKIEASLGIVEGLFSFLRSEPMLFLLITQQGKEISFGVSYWGINAKHSFSDYLLTEEEGKEILKYCVEKLQRQGVKPEELETSALRECGRVMSKCITLMGAFFSDTHYLVYESISPQLPQFLPQLLQGIEDIPVVQRLVGEMMVAYEVILDELQQDRASLIPDLALDMAQALASINRNFAQAKLDYALKSWLQLRGVSSNFSSSLLELIGDNVAYGDQDFLQRLQQVYERLNNNQASARVKQIENSINLTIKKSVALIYSIPAHPGWINSVKFSPDGKTLASCANWERKAIKLWNVRNGQLKSYFTDNTITSVNLITFSPDGQTLASGSDKTVKLWDINSSRTKSNFTDDFEHIFCVVFSPDGQTLAISSSNSEIIKLGDIKKCKIKSTLTGHSDCVLSMAFSLDNQVLISGSRDNTIKIWDLNTCTNKLTLKEHCGFVYSVVLSPDSKTLATASGDNTIKLWDMNTYKVGITITGHDDSVYSVAFSPDGQTLASGSRDGTIKLWNVKNAKLKATLTDHNDEVTSVAFSPDGRLLASGSYDTTIKLWHIPVGF